MLVPGMLIGDRYEIVEKIGSGGMSDVYKARCHKLNRFVAIKVLKTEYSQDATFVKKFRVEAQSAAGLSHPNIVNVYDVGEDNGIHYIVMELVQGITLKEYIDMKGRLDIKEALNISVQIASGLSAAHDNRIIHRDVKPQNIIMSKDGKVKVTDFGIAKAADSTTVTTNAAGTVYYISPEQARGGYSDAKSDIYSLGITMYEMITGRVPFEGETNVAVALLHIQGEMTPPRELVPSIPRSYEKIILKCTQKKPDRRYSSCKELIADLRKVLTYPDGDYVVIGGPSGMTGSRTVVMDENEMGMINNRRNTEQMNPQRRTQSGRQINQANNNTNVQKRRQDSQNDVYDENDEKEVHSSMEKVMMVLGIVGAVILAVILIFIIGRAFGMFGSSRDKESKTTASTESVSETLEQVEVPDLYNLEEEAAKKELNDRNLGVLVKREKNDEVSEGRVFKQDYKAGDMVDLNTQVTIYISDGEETITLENYSGQDFEEVQTILKGLGLTGTVDKYEYNDEYEENQVIKTDPAAGSQVKEGDRIKMTVSKGPEPVEQVAVPGLVGSTEEQAIQQLSALGLVPNVSEAHSSSVAKGYVINQTHSKGTKVDVGTTIGFTVSLGPEETEPAKGSATIKIDSSPLAQDSTDAQGNPIKSSGHVTVEVVDKNGSIIKTFDLGTCYNDSFPKTAGTVTGTVGNATVNVYVDGTFADAWTITIN